MNPSKDSISHKKKDDSQGSQFSAILGFDHHSNGQGTRVATDRYFHSQADGAEAGVVVPVQVLVQNDDVRLQGVGQEGRHVPCAGGGRPRPGALHSQQQS